MKQHVTLAMLILSLAPGAFAARQPWAFAAIADPRPLTFKNGFQEDLRFFKSQIIDQATPEMPAPEFLAVAGDMDPMTLCDQLIAETLGAQFPWLPILGNHDLEWRHDIPRILGRFRRLNIVWGPDGTKDCQYSLTHKGLLFVGVNQYWNGGNGQGAEIGNLSDGRPDADIVPANLAWLRRILAATPARWKIVAGHEPAWPFHRHDEDSLADEPANRDAFWKMLDETNTHLYFCGHTHRYGTYQWPGNQYGERWNDHVSRLLPHPVGVWQVDAGALRGSVRQNADDRTVIYCRVADDRISRHTYQSRRLGKGRFAPWGVPPNDLDDAEGPTLYRWDIFPSVRQNLVAEQFPRHYSVAALANGRRSPWWAVWKRW